MKKKKEIEITAYSFCRVGTEDKAQEFVDIMLNNGLQPLKYDTAERTRHIFERDKFVEFWVNLEKKRGFGGPLIKGKGFYADVGWGGRKPYNSGFNLDVRSLPNIEILLNLSRSLYNWYGAVYAYAGLEAIEKLYTPGFSILSCLGGITWANFFGKPYVDMWGEEKLLKAPTWRTERLDDGGFLLITTESPLTDPAIAAEAEAKLRAYLGEEHFYRRPIDEPKWITKEELYEKVFGDHEPEPTGYVAPDFGKYYDIDQPDIRILVQLSNDKDSNAGRNKKPS